MTITRIPEIQFQKRRELFLKKIVDLGIENFIVLSPTSIYYLTGFSMIPTERPFMLVFKRDKMNFFVPELERLHVIEELPDCNLVKSYFEYPDVIHPLQHFAKFIKNDLGISSKLGAEGSGARGIWGYQGPLFKDVLKFPVKVFSDIITDMRIIKDKYELECIREAAKWGDLAHRLLQKYTKVGENEIDVSFRATHEASKEMRETLGSDYSPLGYGARPCGAGYRGQIGNYSAIPHAMTRNAIFKKGDTLVTGASANIAGYHSELERTMFMGEPSEKQREYFGIMVKAQEAAFNTIRPDIPLSKVDQATRTIFKEAGVFDLVLHHTGHSIGLEAHERPFFDVGLNDLIEPGMVFTVEPGIYDRTVGGFRHSDTIIVTENGIDIITATYPRDIESLIIYE
ncbi:MAG: M24 family metallopeptidase [Candidatus Hodarchaeales archaeon]